MTNSNPHPDTTECPTRDKSVLTLLDQDTISELTTLYDASDGGRAEWWPGEIEYRDDDYWGGWVYAEASLYPRGEVVCMEPHHALAIVRDSAERWLVEQDWSIHKTDSLLITLASYLTYEQGPIHSLADAIRVEMGREG